MLSFRRALLIAAGLITFFLVLRSTHRSEDDGLPRMHRADELPRPGPWNLRGHNEAAKPQETWRPSAGLQTSTARPPKAPKPKEQINLSDLKEKPLKEQLEYQFPYDPAVKFPAYIWQTWKYTPASGEFGEDYRKYEASWTLMHPTFVHEVITDDVAVSLLRHLYASVPEVIEAYQALPLPVLKADFFRYLILLARGGIYTDIDTAALKPATEWVPEGVPSSSYGMVIGIEADPDREDWAEWYSRRIQFCQWTIQAKPGHPILRQVVANITEETLKRKHDGSLKNINTSKIVEYTGPALWTDIIFSYFNDPEIFDMGAGSKNITNLDFTGLKKQIKVGDVVVLPITSFSPGVKQMGAGEDDDPMAFVKHMFNGEWTLPCPHSIPAKGGEG